MIEEVHIIVASGHHFFGIVKFENPTTLVLQTNDGDCTLYISTITLKESLAVYNARKARKSEERKAMWARAEEEAKKEHNKRELVEARRPRSLLDRILGC